MGAASTVRVSNPAVRLTSLRPSSALQFVIALTRARWKAGPVSGRPSATRISPVSGAMVLSGGSLNTPRLDVSGAGIQSIPAPWRTSQGMCSASGVRCLPSRTGELEIQVAPPTSR